jgi:5-methyltetrahydrofolate--homocysteine methyltransferase
MSAEAAQEIFAEQVSGLVDGGADLILIETMSDLGELAAAVRAAHDVAPQLEVLATLSFDTNRHTMMGVSPLRAVRELAELGVAGGGANCGRGPADIEAVMADMAGARPAGMLLVAQTNAGLPQLKDGEFRYDVGPDELAACARRLHGLGVEIVGGCCGSTPAHIAAIASALAADGALR